MLDQIRRVNVGRASAVVVSIAMFAVPVVVLGTPAHAAGAATRCAPKWRKQASNPKRKITQLAVVRSPCPQTVKVIRAWGTRGARPGCITGPARVSRCNVQGYKCTNRLSYLTPKDGSKYYDGARYKASCSSGKRSVRFTAVVTGCGPSGSLPSKSRSGRYCSPILPSSSEGPADSIIDFVTELAKEHLKNFLMEQIGLPSPESELKVLSDKIDALRAALSSTESRLSTQLAELGFRKRLDDIFDYNAELLNLYTKYFQPTVSAIIKVKAAQAKKPVDQPAIDSAMADYNTHKAGFIREADILKVGALTRKIHIRLQPAVGDGMLREYGHVILGHHRNVNSSDSKLVIDLYTFAEENQALASWMEVEREFAVGGSSVDLAQATLSELAKDSQSQRDGSAVNGLHAPIPPGVVIDRGPDGSVESYTTKNKTMYMFFKPTDLTWAPYAFNPPSGDTVPNAEHYANGAKLRGFTGWSAPSGAQLYSLFTGLTARKHEETVKYLSGLFEDSKLTVGDWLWDTDTVRQRYCVTKKGGGTNCNNFYVAHRGISTSSLSNDIHPQFEYVQDKEADSRFHKAVGGLLLGRDTGDAQYLP